MSADDTSDVNSQDEQGRTKLHYAAKRNDVPEIKRLLSLGADVNVKAKWSDQTPLHYAAASNYKAKYFQSIEILLKNGADVNAKDEDRKTPLHWLANEGNVKIVKLLLDFGADVNARNLEGDIPLAEAVSGKNNEVVRLLLDNNSNVHFFNIVNGTTLLHRACLEGNLEIIKWLLKENVDIGATDYKGNTPLMIELENYSSEIVIIFLLKYSDVNDKCENGRSVLSINECIFARKIFLKHIAKLQALNITVNSDLLDKIPEFYGFRSFFKQCTNELAEAKNTKLKNSWVTYFNLLVDNKKKLKNYAGNSDLIKDFQSSDCENKFPIYGADMQENVDNAIERRKIFDKSTGVLSNNLPIFGPTHLIVRNMLDCLTFKDLAKLVSEVKKNH